MIELCLLGSGGTMPMPDRALTSLLVRWEGRSLLIDCGEGTQVQIRRRKWSMMAIDHIFITHLHADHVAGLPGLLLSMAKDGRREPVVICGPAGLGPVVAGLRMIAPELPFPLEVRELKAPCTLNLGQLHVKAFPAEHGVPCFGYSLQMDRAARFDPDKARALNLPPRLWGKLQKGEPVEWNGSTVEPSQVLGPPRRGIQVSYVTDTRPTEAVLRGVQGADLLICEGMYADPVRQDKALKNFHMMFAEAAELARQAGAGELWLTHYSPSLEDPQLWMEGVRAVFPNALPAQDLMTKTLRYPE